MEDNTIYKLTVTYYLITSRTGPELRESDKFDTKMSDPQKLAPSPRTFHFKSIKAAFKSSIVYKEVLFDKLAEKYPQISFMDVSIHYKQVCRSLQAKNKFVKELKIFEEYKEDYFEERKRNYLEQHGKEAYEAFINNKLYANRKRRDYIIKHNIKVEISKEVLYSRAITKALYT